MSRQQSGEGNPIFYEYLSLHQQTQQNFNSDAQYRVVELTDDGNLHRFDQTAFRRSSQQQHPIEPYSELWPNAIDNLNFLTDLQDDNTVQQQPANHYIEHQQSSIFRSHQVDESSEQRCHGQYLTVPQLLEYEQPIMGLRYQQAYSQDLRLSQQLEYQQPNMVGLKHQEPDNDDCHRPVQQNYYPQAAYLKQVTNRNEENPKELSIDLCTGCIICGDVADKKYYGVKSCWACKCFFQRSLWSSFDYKCKESSNCKINRYTRAKCRYCRYQRCKAAGMVRKDLLLGFTRRWNHLRQIHELYSNKSDSDSTLGSITTSTSCVDSASAGPPIFED